MKNQNEKKVRRVFAFGGKAILLLLFVILVGGMSCKYQSKKEETVKPNILILMSDNQSWNHLSCAGDPVLKTPAIDKIAKEGVRFTNAYCSAPSCAPARASMLTGQNIWRLEEAANLWGSFPPKFEVYTQLLENTGYYVGYEGKGWGPGNYKDGGREKDPSGKKYKSFEEFYTQRKEGQPFCYWFCSGDPHRPYEAEGWQSLGDAVDDIVVPPYLPDVREVKEDIGDYYSEVQRFDRDVNTFMQFLKDKGDLENTLVIVCSDNGWQMPRGLANMYDFGTRIPLVVSMPSKYKGDRVVDDFINLGDFAPTFLELAGVDIPEEMDARSFVDILESGQEGIVDTSRNFIVTGRERHAFVRKNGAGYGCRAYRNNDFLYIRNYDFENWPAGDPPLYGDVDAHMMHHPCATKMYILKNKDKEEVKKYYELGFGKRPAEELYDLKTDPWQINNVAYSEEYKEIKEALSKKLTRYLVKTGDPRETGAEMKWIRAKYYAGHDKYPTPSKEAQKELGLKEKYSYVE